MQSSSQIITTNKPTSYFLQAFPVTQPTVSKHCRENSTFHRVAYPKLTWGSSIFVTTNRSKLPWGDLPFLSSALWCQYPTRNNNLLQEIWFTEINFRSSWMSVHRRYFNPKSYFWGHVIYCVWRINMLKLGLLLTAGLLLTVTINLHMLQYSCVGTVVCLCNDNRQHFWINIYCRRTTRIVDVQWY